MCLLVLLPRADVQPARMHGDYERMHNDGSFPMRKKPFLPALVGWLCAAILAVVLPLSTPAVAQLSTQSAAPPVEVSLVADHDSVAPGSPLKLGVHFKIPEGWHIYYREPGETGKPTEVIFTLPAGTTAGDGSKLEWRQPSRFTDFGAVSYGYERDALIATNVTVTEVKAGTTSVTFRAHVTWLACHDECVQGSADVELTLPVATAGSAPQATNADLFAGLKAGDAIQVGAPKPRVLDGSPVEVESMDGGSSSVGFLTALVFAFLGGLVLNLMPCVLPVLSFKILGFVHQSGQDSRKVFLHGLWYTAGTLASFAALAAAVVGLRSAGAMVGWGFQFQSPTFLVVLATIVLTMALSMFGLFYFNFRTSQGLVGLSNKSGYGGSFFTGVLATILATPCSAPFLGTAIGFAFVQPAVVIVAIFLTIGIGLAAPYLVLSANPAWLRWIPKHGAWMETFKQTMGFLMLATVVWLVSIIAHQVGVAGIGWVLAFLLAVSFAAFLWSHLAGPMASDRRRLTVGITLVAALVGAYLYCVKPVTDKVGLQPVQTGQVTTPASSHVSFQPFTRADLDKALASGKVVFVDFTAQWCAVCQVNEKLAIDTPATRAALDRLGVVAIKADWTSPNDEIATVLASLGRHELPTYVIFPADPDAKPILLTTIISEKELIDALERAAKGK